MKKFILLFYTMLVFANNYTYASNNNYHTHHECENDGEYEVLNINDFTSSSLQKYNVDPSTGVLYRNIHNKTYYPIYDGYKCYDLKTEIEQMNTTYSMIPNIQNGGNIVVKNTNCKGKYIIDDTGDCYDMVYNKDIVESLGKPEEKFLSVRIPSNTNIIIPYGTTLVQDDVTFHISGSNVNLIVLGKITNHKKYDYINALFYFPSRYCNVIIGPNAKIEFNNMGHDSMFWLEKLSSSIILYPGCSLMTSSTEGANGEKDTVSLKSKLYLNRYTPELYYLAQPISGIISEEMNVIYPAHIANNLMYTEKNILNTEVLHFNDYVKIDYFPNLHWRGNLHNIGNNNSEYNFEAVEPLSYNLDKNKQKLILGLNPNNQFAKYDIAFWIQCTFDGHNGFSKYNQLAYKGAYIDLNKINNLFYNMKENEQLIIKENKIYPGLIGNLTIKVDLKNITHNNKLYVYGDNREFGGILIIPSKINEIIYDNDYCTIKNVIQAGKNGNVSKPDLSEVKISYRNFANWNLYFNERILNMNLPNDNYMTNTVTFKDSDDDNKVMIVTGPGNNKKFNSVEVFFDKIKVIKLFNKSCTCKTDMNNMKLDYAQNNNGIKWKSNIVEEIIYEKDQEDSN